MIELEYSPNPRPRYGHGLPAHPELRMFLNQYRSSYRNALSSILALESRFRDITNDSKNERDPDWHDTFFYSLDALSLYMFIERYRPQRLIEVGSGNSTRFARAAVRDFGLRTKITSIDPSPRQAIKEVADEIVQSRLEDMSSLEMFYGLKSGDIVFFDGSHVSHMNSDVSVFFLEILPRLTPGVVVQIHDIWLPYDYPPEWTKRFYSEQYLLAAFVLGGAKGLRPLLSNAFVWGDLELSQIINPLVEELGYQGWRRHGTSFWFEIVGCS